SQSLDPPYKTVAGKTSLNHSCYACTRRRFVKEWREILRRKAVSELNHSPTLPNSMKQQSDAPKESPVEPWKHLVRRVHPWRKQLYVRGRNATVGQIHGTI